VRFDGLIRDTVLAPDGKYLWVLNWEKSTWQVVDAHSLKPHCSIGLRADGLLTPWNMAVNGTTVYLSNVTYPLVAEYDAGILDEQCRVVPERTMNLFASGYTRFTDGVYGIYFDPLGQKLYATTAMLEGRYLTGFIEIDPLTFQITREVRAPGGMTIEPVEGTNNILFPSYYRDSIFEISLTKMEIVRSIKAAANILSLKFDRARGLIYAASKVAGELLVIDYATGKTLARAPIGARPGALAYEKENDLLFVASKLGIIQIEVPTFLTALSIVR
jgi:DNA-binding beta-propeller fold protein YncE